MKWEEKMTNKKKSKMRRKSELWNVNAKCIEMKAKF
jgi:hypothetical protein